MSEREKATISHRRMMMQSGRLRNPATRYWLYEFLGLRDGLKCAICGASDAERELIIDHKDGNTQNWGKDNLRLLCRKCNVPQKWTIGLDSIPLEMRERERVVIRSEGALELRDASVELRLSREKEPMFRGWLMQRLLQEGSVLLVDAINGGAEVCEVSPLTTRRYLAKLVSSQGPLYIYDKVQVRVRSEHWAKLALPEEKAKEGLK